MIGKYEMTLDDYVAILRRRLWILLVPLVLGPAVGFALSKLLPPRYTSSTLVLVEQQKVPERFVPSVITDMLNQRLMTMQETILSRSRLLPIIEKFDLFKEDRGKQPMEALVARMRSNVAVTPIRPVARGNNTEYPGFYISFTNSDPRVAQQVCSEITSEFMKENLVIREQAASGTTDFLIKQLDDAKRQLDDKDAKLAEFKQRYFGQLPGQEDKIYQLLISQTTQLEAASQALNRAQQDKAFMESVLSQQLAAWDATKSGQNPLTLEQQLVQQENGLMALEARYTPDHPDVIKARSEVAALKVRIEEAKKSTATAKEAESAAAVTEPPQIQQQRAQIYRNNQIIQEKTRDQERLQKEIKVTQGRLQLSPVVEQQFKELTRDYETALESYHDLLRKKTQSVMATDLEKRQQGEQFRVIDSANLPARPSFPDPLLFSGGGLAGGMGLGLAIILLLEVRDRALRTQRDIEVLLELPTLALIPFVEAADAKKKRTWGFGRKPKPVHAPGVTA